MVLVDTSVWVDHLRKGSAALRRLLLDEQVLGHPLVVGELACGTLRNREEILVLLRALPQAQLAEHDEVLQLVDSERIHGQGVGWVDAHLIASALISRCTLWTLDTRLNRVAKSLSIQLH